MDFLIEGIRKNSFVVLGRAGMDMFAEPVGARADTAETFRSDLGGSSANICAGLCKLGAQSALVTSVSDDAVGRFCTNRLKYYGVDTQYLKILSGEYRISLAVYESVIEDFQLVIYRNNAVDFQVTNEDVDRVKYSNFGALITAGTVFAAEPSRGSTFRAFENARAAKIPIIFDIDYRPYSWPSPEVAAEVLSCAGEQSDLIVGNEEEFGFPDFFGLGKVFFNFLLSNNKLTNKLRPSNKRAICCPNMKTNINRRINITTNRITKKVIIINPNTR